jgi:hypothetical protein
MRSIRNTRKHCVKKRENTMTSTADYAATAIPTIDATRPAQLERVTFSLG